MARVAMLEVEERGSWYEVRVFDPATHEEIAEYMAGNSIWESQGHLEPGTPQTHGFEKMLELGRVTLWEMADEHGAAVDEVARVLDEDGELVKEV